MKIDYRVHCHRCPSCGVIQSQITVAETMNRHCICSAGGNKEESITPGLKELTMFKRFLKRS